MEVSATVSLPAALGWGEESTLIAQEGIEMDAGKTHTFKKLSKFQDSTTSLPPLIS